MIIKFYTLKNQLWITLWKRNAHSWLEPLRLKVIFFLNLEIKDLLPNILKQLGPKQWGVVKDFADQLKAQDKQKTPEEAPELVNFEEVSKQN